MADIEEEEPQSKRTAVIIKTSVEWKDWLSRFAESNRTSVSALIDQAVVEFAKSRGFDELPPPR